jgi:hypothetical protein
VRTFNFMCNGMATYSFQPSPNPPMNIDFPIDVNILTGALRMPNVQLGSEGEVPKYDLQAPSTLNRVTADYYDFDLDGEPDASYCGTQTSTGDFLLSGECQTATVQGIYLSSADNDPNGAGCNDDPAEKLCQPNFVRIIDLEKEAEDKARVSTLAPEHLQDTDLFVVRQANGQLVAQRQGLKDSENAYVPEAGDALANNDIVTLQGEVRVDYGLIMRGIRDLSNQYVVNNAQQEAANGESGFSRWQANGNMAPELYSQNNSDAIRPGETLEVWAINRVTGYIGHAEVVVGENALSQDQLDTRVPDIQLQPPNLKIWAERRYNIEAGLTQGEQRDYLISHEGAGEGDDTYIQIFVEWLDQDGPCQTPWPTTATPAAWRMYRVQTP